jgi:N6-adenosine-specific RNA methylase IME4
VTQLIKFDARLATVTETALQLRSGLDFEEWQAIGGQLRRVEKAALWWIGDWLNYGERAYGETYAQALEETDRALSTLQGAKWVAARVEPCRRRQEVPYSIHCEVASLPAEQQEAVLREAERDGLTVREVRTKVRALKPAPHVPALPTGKYRILYADPPWQYRDELIEGYGAAEHHYRTLTLEQLQSLKDDAGQFVGDLAADAAVLFLWATSPLLDDALTIITAWGFEYKTSFVWDKVKHNFGHYNSVRHELLLVATRGSCTPDNATLFDSVQSIERTDRHSEKPEEFRKIIDALYSQPSGRVDRIELFRRGEAPNGWHVWGNEADADRLLQETA